MTVGVLRCSKPVYSDRLVKGLRDAGLFARVDHLGAYDSAPDLTAEVHRAKCGTATVPTWTHLTLGILPCSVDENWGYSFWLASAGAPEDRALVEYVHRGRTTHGWITLLDAFHPDRTVVPWAPRDSDRMREQLRLAIVRDGLPGVLDADRPGSRDSGTRRAGHPFGQPALVGSKGPDPVGAEARCAP